MGLRKDIKSLTQKIENLEEMLNTTTAYKAHKYDEITFLLKKVKLKAKTTKKISENGDLELIVSYNVPDVILTFNHNGNCFEWTNDFFYSTNKLDLLDQESYKNITKAMEEIKEQLKK